MLVGDSFVCREDSAYVRVWYAQQFTKAENVQVMRTYSEPLNIGLQVVSCVSQHGMGVR